MIWVLITKTWRDHWKGTLSWAFGLFSIAAIQLMVYPTVKKSAAGTAQLMESMPEAFKTVFRMTDYTSGPGFLGAELFSFMVPLILIAVGANAGARATAEEETMGTADLLLTLPLSRTKIILSKVLASLVVIIVLSTLLAFTLLIGVDLAGLVTPRAGLIAACVDVALLGSLFTAVGLLVGALAGRKGIALGASIALALAAFLLYSLAPLVGWLADWLWINPFQWAIGNDPLRNGIDGGYAFRFLLVTTALIFGAVTAFNRRDIST